MGKLSGGRECTPTRRRRLSIFFKKKIKAACVGILVRELENQASKFEPETSSLTSPMWVGGGGLCNIYKQIRTCAVRVRKLSVLLGNPPNIPIPIEYEGIETDTMIIYKKKSGWNCVMVNIPKNPSERKLSPCVDSFDNFDSPPPSLVGFGRSREKTLCGGGSHVKGCSVETRLLKPACTIMSVSCISSRPAACRPWDG